MFVMRLLRPGIPLPGSEPRTPTTFVSVPYSEFLSRINSNQVHKVEVDGVHIMFKLKNEGSSQEIEPLRWVAVRSFKNWSRCTPLRGQLISRPLTRRCSIIRWSSALFYVAVLAGLLHRFPVSFTQHAAGQIGNRKSRGSGGAKVSEQGETITFADVAGVDKAKEELEEIVEFLRNIYGLVLILLEVFSCMTLFILQMGLPGTGKTLLAKAVAAEADVPFISYSASEFVELYAGMGASRIDALAKSHDGRYWIVSNDEQECQECHRLCFLGDSTDDLDAVKWELC
ncbi:hypothetical protein LWI28_009093 [Acer negundo]|uniref:ATPase AAA-type core domain-containing protein n=1 Tax=Acer negundo TaxID=4023 RepID=A0AAD5JMG0_ACENE|nr:hypothetical protein LWI28_009093 [Acer negundo]